MTMAKAQSGAHPVPWTLALCWLAALTEGFDIQSMGVAAPGLAPALALSRDQLGPAFSASLIGLMIGALVLGRLADRFGRKWILITSLATFAVFSAATAFAWNLNSLLTIRVLAGLGLGGAMPNLTALAAEAVAEDRRARVVTLVTAGYPFGGALAGAIAASAGWREIFIVGGVAPLLLAPLMAAALPESRGFLAARRRRDAATMPRTGYRWILFGESRALTTPLLWGASFLAALSLYLLLNWLPMLMGYKGVGKAEASLVSMLFNIGAGVGVLVLAPLLDRRRRVWIMAAWYVALAGSVIWLAAARPDLTSAGTAGFAAGFFVASASVAFYGLASCYYPVTIRGAGVGAAVAVGRFGGIIGPLLAAALLSAGVGAAGVLIALLPLASVAGAATLVLLVRPTVVD
ncbi:MAG TPA: MFS transporter [Caulobacteraceae bacterium]